MKNLQNNFPDITSDNLLSGKLSSWVPELYEQKDVIAINPWHDHQSIFDHTVSVISSAEHIMTFPFAGDSYREKLIELLNKEIDGVSRQHIILAITLLHDVGCSKTMVADPKTGQNNCPGHEIAGRDMSVAICTRWGLSKTLIDRISGVVFHHLDAHRTVNAIMKSGNSEPAFRALQKKVGDLYFDLLIQGYADTAGSDLPILQPKEFLFRENIYKEELIRFAASL